MASSQTVRWSLEGDFLENCNCDIVCPCLVSTNALLTSRPTQGDCESLFGFHIESGDFDGTRLDGLNAAVVAHTPGPMADGNWAVAVYIDDKADPAQTKALQTIFGGAGGGPIGNLVPLISSVLGVESVPITWRKDGLNRSMQIGTTGAIIVKALPSGAPGQEIWIDNVHPFAHRVSMAVGEKGSVWSGHGMTWDNSGKNGHYAPISWTNA